MIPPIAYDKTGDLIIVIIHYFCQKTIKDVVCSIESKILFQSYAIKRITSTIINNPFLENTRNIVLLGPTGVGKSKIIDLLARELESPYAKIDGYNGDSLINAYLTLFLNKKNQDLIGPPIIFIDGINKGIEKLGKLDGDILVEIISKIVKMIAETANGITSAKV